ncbi:MAG: winged helix-turn-helix transcriptional regulator [Planctomycetes bacterium]|nr:winged helix-turn-helix transcriptional regulator [Planctomycetota bacterium]
MNSNNNGAEQAWRDLQILEEIEQNPETSQRGIAQRVGIALGLTNNILRRLIRKGLVKSKSLPANRFAYYLTRKGFKEKTKLVLDYVKLTTSFFCKVRLLINTELARLKTENDIESVAIYGVGELAEAVYLSVSEQGLTLNAVYDGKKAGEKWLNTEIRQFAPEAVDADVLLVAQDDAELEGLEDKTDSATIVVRIGDLLAADLRAFAKTME